MTTETAFKYAAPPPLPERPVRPGAYLRLRRVAAGLNLDDVAAIIASEIRFRPQAVLLLHRLERDRITSAVDVRIMLAVLNGAFPFNAGIYGQLADHAADPDTELPAPRVCIVCGCSWHDCCTEAGGEPCAWIPGLDLCSACPIPPDYAAALAAVTGGPAHA